MRHPRHSEAFIETPRLANGYMAEKRDGSDRKLMIFSETVTEYTIALLNERRVALIAAAVTGKISIRESMHDHVSGDRHEN